MKKSIKMIWKDENGAPCAVLTVEIGGKTLLSDTGGVRPILIAIDDKILPYEGGALSPHLTACGGLSVLGEAGGGRLFATTLKGDAARMMRWTLTQKTNELPKSPYETKGKDEAAYPQKEGLPPMESLPNAERCEWSCEQADVIDQTDTLPSDADARTRSDPPLSEIARSPAEAPMGERSDATAGVPEASVASDPLLEKARRLIEKGEPFPLFDELMPDSVWAKIEDEDCLFLIGIVKEEEGERVLYGIAGTRAYPPDEDRLWTFFPTENEEEGYYLTEAEVCSEAAADLPIGDRE